MIHKCKFCNHTLIRPVECCDSGYLFYEIDLDDSEIKQYHKDMTQAEIDGNVSEIHEEWVNLRVYESIYESNKVWNGIVPF